MAGGAVAVDTGEVCDGRSARRSLPAKVHAAAGRVRADAARRVVAEHLPAARALPRRGSAPRVRRARVGERGERGQRRARFELAAERERCQVGPKDASWPMNPYRNTAIKG